MWRRLALCLWGIGTIRTGVGVILSPRAGRVRQRPAYPPSGGYPSDHARGEIALSRPARSRFKLAPVAQKPDAPDAVETRCRPAVLHLRTDVGWPSGDDGGKGERECPEKRKQPKQPRNSHRQ